MPYTPIPDATALPTPHPWPLSPLPPLTQALRPHRSHPLGPDRLRRAAYRPPPHGPMERHRGVLGLGVQGVGGVGLGVQGVGGVGLGVQGVGGVGLGVQVLGV